MNLTTITVLCTLQLVMTNITCGNTLKYNMNLNSISKINKSIAKVFPLFVSYTHLCLISRNEDILDNFIDYVKLRNKTVSIKEFGQSFDFCDSVIVFDISVAEDCEKIVIERNRPLYFLNYHLKPSLNILEKCGVSSLPSETVSVSLASGFLFRLNLYTSKSPFYKRVSVEEILTRRKKSKKINLKGKVVNVAYDPNPPFFIATGDQNKPDGIEYLLFKELASQLNFTMKLLSYKNWGTLNDNGEWENGIIKSVESGEAELALSVIWIIKTIYNSLDFGPSLNNMKLVFIVRRPEAVEFQWKNLLAIFRPLVWVIIMLLFVSVTVVYWIGINKDHHTKQTSSWIGCILTTLGITFQTSFPRRKVDRLVRYILLGWSIFSLLLTTILSGNVFCGLSLPQYSSRVDTIKQLVRGNYYWTVQYYARFNSSGLRSDIFDFKNHWVRTFEKQYKYLTSEEVKCKAYFDKKVVFLTENFGKDLVYIDTEGLQGHHALTNFRLMKEDVTSTHVTFGVAKQSQLLEPLTIMTLRFMEAGIYNQWTEQVLRKYPIFNTRHLMVEKDITSFIKPRQLSLNKLYPVFYLLLFGLVASSVVFVLEKNIYTLT